jgi:hypothetical protein
MTRKCRGLHTGDNVVTIGAEAQYAWQGGYFSEPATVVLSLELDGEDHSIK